MRDVYEDIEPAEAFKTADSNAAELIKHSGEDTPEQAVKTITRAKKHNMGTAEYDSIKDVADPEEDIQDNTPRVVSQANQNYMAKSKQHTKVVKNDITNMELFSRIARHTWYNLTEKHKLEGQIQEIHIEDRLSGDKGLSDERYLELDTLLEMQAEEQGQFELEGLGTKKGEIEALDFTAVPGSVASLVNDMAGVVTSIEGLALMGGGAAVGAATPVPGGTLVGAGVGAAAAFGLDAYKRTVDATWGSLRTMKKDNGTPLDISRKQRANISMGVGLTAGLLEFASGKVLTGAIGKLLGQKTNVTKVIKKPALRAVLDALGAISVSAVSQGGEEVTAEIAQIVGENYAKTDKSEAGFISAVNKTVDDMTNDLKTQKRLGMTGLVGAVGGGTITGAMAVLSFNRARKNYIKNNESLKRQGDVKQVTSDAVKILQHQEGYKQMGSVLNNTELSKLSPEELRTYRMEIFGDTGIDHKVFIKQEDLELIRESNPELAEKIEAMDMTEGSKNETGSPIGLQPHDFLELVQDAPDISEYGRLNPEAPNPREAKVMLERLEDANRRINEIFDSLGADQELTVEQTAELLDIDDEVNAAVDENTEEAYLNSPTFTEGVESVISEKDAAKFNAAQRKARESVLNEIQDKFDTQEQQKENRVVKANEAIHKAAQLRENQKNIEIVERFEQGTGFDQDFHTKSGFSSYAIDPKYLPIEVRQALETDPKLTKRKVFVEGGVSPEESAAMMGLESGDQLINILANTPTKEEFTAQRKEQSIKLREQVKESRSVNKEARLEKAYEGLQKAHLKEMNYMRESEWGSIKIGFRKINLPIPKIADLNFKAAKIIRDTRVDALSPRQFKSGEKAAQVEAHRNIINNKVEAAFQAKEKAMLNVELQKEAMRAKVKIEKARVFVSKLTSKKGMNNIKSKAIRSEINNIMDVFALEHSSKKGAARKASYVDYVKSRVDAGETVIVPEAIADVKQRGGDMTTDQFLKVTNRLRNLVHQSKMINRLQKVQAKRAELGKLQTEEAIVMDAREDLEGHSSYVENRGDKEASNKNSKFFVDKTLSAINLRTTMLTNLKNIVTEMDQEALGGQHYQNIAQPLVDSETFKRDRNLQVVNKIKEFGDQYGSKEFKAAFNTKLNINEFAGYKDLGYGTMVKSDLWRLFTYLGDPQGRERIANFKHIKTGEPMTVDTVLKVLETHLDEKDANLAQNFTNIFKSFEKEGADLALNTTGIEVNMVKGVPITFKGKVYEGGYTPLDYLNVSNADKVSRFLDSLGKKETSMFGEGKDTDTEKAKMYSRLRAAEHTEQGRQMDRTGSQKALDTSFMGLLQGYEEHIHDIAYRESGMDVMKLLKNEVYREAIINTVGEAKYNTMVNSIIETVGKAHEADTLSPFSKERNAADATYKYLEQGFNIGVLGFNWKSVMMQPLSTGAAAMRMGPKGARYLIKSLGNTLANLNNYGELFEEISVINPDLKTAMDSVDDTMVASLHDEIPQTDLMFKNDKVNKGALMLKHGLKSFREASMWGLKNLDIHIKAMVSGGAYAQFKNGDAKNFGIDKLATMTTAEIEVAARRYVKQVADLALTTSADIDKSAVEKISSMRIVTRFYTDLRAQQQTGISQIRKVRNSVKQGKYGQGAVDASALFMIYSLNKLYIDMLYGEEENPVTEMGDVSNFSDLGDWLLNTTGYVVGAPVGGLVGSIPFAKEVKYATESWSRKKEVNLPITKTLSDMSQGIVGLLDIFSDREMSPQTRKALLHSVSFAVKGIPVNAMLRAYESYENSDVVDYVTQQGSFLADFADKFINENKDNEEMQDQVEAMKEVKKIVAAPQNQDVKTLIPEDSMEVMKLNKWDDLDPETGAVGVYQFTEERWNQIADENPDLGLSDNGRVSKDSRQQEKAMKYSIKKNSESLLSYGLEINNRNLYGSHKFGVDNYSLIMLSDDSDKLSSIVSNDKLFKGFKTVKDVKQYVNKHIPIDSENN